MIESRADPPGGRRHLRGWIAAPVVAVVLLTGCLPLWRFPHGDLARTGWNSEERVIGASNAASLTEQWRAFSPTGTGLNIRAVTEDFAYGTDDQNMYAFPVEPGANCSGTPLTCTPLWSAPARRNRVIVPGQWAWASVGDGVGYRVVAYDADGVDGCSGSPKVCAPLWQTTAFGSSSFDKYTVAGQWVIVSDDFSDKISVFDGFGERQCTGVVPKTCTPVWTLDATGGDPFEVAVANGLIYATHDGRVKAYDLDGVDNCTGADGSRVCSPLWMTTNGMVGAPIVVNDRVYVHNTAPWAFDALGVNGCTGSPIKTCSPLWFGTGSLGLENLEAASPTIVVGTQKPTTARQLAVWDTSGPPRCNGATPDSCALRFRTPNGGNISDVVIANDVLWAVVGLSASAWRTDSISGFQPGNCSGPCPPIATYATVSGLVLASGQLYLGSSGTNPLRVMAP